MSLESPVTSERDSLGENEPMEKHHDESNFVRGHVNYTTFTRPTNLHRNKSRGHRQSLLSPHSVDNLDTDDANTPDFAMTQSMYEPNGKKEQIEKMTQQSKLMNLIASEKAAYAAQKRKQKEMKQKAIDQKRRNEERQKVVEERRIRMLAEEEEKRKRIMNKMTKSNNITTSCYGNMTQSITIKNKSCSNSKFLASRPLSSTGKIFGFGSSAPRYICDPIKQERSGPKTPSLLDMNKESLPLSRMCASQIMSRSSHADMRGRSERNLTANISKSAANLAENSRNKNGRVSVTQINNDSNTKRTEHIQRITPKSIKTASKLDTVSRSPVEIFRRSRPSTREVTTPTKTSRSISTDKHLQSPVKPKPLRSNVLDKKSPKSMTKSHENKINLSKSELPRSTNTRSLEPGINQSSDSLNYESNVGKKAEVRFVNEVQHSNKSDKENVNQIPDSTNTISKEMTKEEYTERMNYKRKLAKEKKLKEEIEREMEKQKQHSDNVVEALTPVDTSITTESEISINILPKDVEVNEIQTTEPIIELESKKEDNNTKELYKENSSEKRDDSISEKCLNSSVTIEISSEPEKMTASTDELDRLDRKKRLELIMSRVKKTPTGSSENVSQHMTVSALQNMMNKGHLSGMSKTAAVLMRNAHRSSELCSSTSDIHSASENIEKPSISMQNLSEINVNPAESSKTDPLKGDDESVSRGDCDGKEDSPKNINTTMETKSNIMQNLSANPEGSYFTSWKEKYSVSDSLDSENDTTEEL